MVVSRTLKTRIKLMLNITGGTDRHLVTVITYWFLFIPVYRKECV